MQDASLFRPILVFVVLLSVAQAVIVSLGFFFPGIRVPDFVNYLIVILAAMACGRVFVHASGRLPSLGEKLTFSAIGVLLALFVNVVFLAGQLIFRGIPATGENLALWMTGTSIAEGERAAFLLSGLALAFGIALLLGFAGIGLGAWQAQRAHRHS